jgi:PAS domain-containing protein
MGQGECAAPSPFAIRRRSSARVADEARAAIARAELRRRGARGATILTESDADRRRFAALLEEAPVGYVITDGYGKIIEGNGAVSSLLHLDVGSLPGKRLLNYVVRDSRRDFYAALLRLREIGAAENVSVVIRPRKGAPLVGITLNALAKHERDGGLIAVHWFLRGLAPGSLVTPAISAASASHAPVEASAP